MQVTGVLCEIQVEVMTTFLVFWYSSKNAMPCSTYFRLWFRFKSFSCSGSSVPPFIPTWNHFTLHKFSKIFYLGMNIGVRQVLLKMANNLKFLWWHTLLPLFISSECSVPAPGTRGHKTGNGQLHVFTLKSYFITTKAVCIQSRTYNFFWKGVNGMQDWFKLFIFLWT